MGIKDPRRTYGSAHLGAGYVGGNGDYPRAGVDGGYYATNGGTAEDACASEAKQQAAYAAGYDCYADKPTNDRNDAVNVLMERAQELRRKAEHLRQQAAKYRAVADESVEQAVLLSRDIDALYAAAQLHAAN